MKTNVFLLPLFIFASLFYGTTVLDRASKGPAHKITRASALAVVHGDIAHAKEAVRDARATVKAESAKIGGK